MCKGAIGSFDEELKEKCLDYESRVWAKNVSFGWIERSLSVWTTLKEIMRVIKYLETSRRT
jgi:hypothetical protein